MYITSRLSKAVESKIHGNIETTETVGNQLPKWTIYELNIKKQPLSQKRFFKKNQPFLWLHLAKNNILLPNYLNIIIHVVYTAIILRE